MTNNTCSGFKAAGIAAGLKKKGKKDLGLMVSEVPATVAGVFTRNRVKAAPVILDRRRIKTGVCQAIIVNSGNANCCTGEQGIRDAETMANLAASELGISEDLVLVASTGVIGESLPIEKIDAAIPTLVDSLKSEGIPDLARSIMTTDTVPKMLSAHGVVNGKTFTVTGVAKGAGMIRPDMATMLCFVCTDVKISSEILKEILVKAVNRSFNRITIDGDTSTNDTVLVMANGLSGAVIQSPAQKDIFQKILDETFLDLAKQLVRDGEGVTKLVEIMVRNALSDSDAQKVVDTVAHSPLVKTAFFGEDANWGRIAGAVGRAGVQIDPYKIDVYFDDVQMVKAGMGQGKTVEAEATKVLKRPEFTVTIDLNSGSGSGSILTCDFSVDYIRINADYRS
ncbi:MAG: bifunctional glutamate N-acetyltransferase/amino-acid acetyltransferase ArgJ [Deltaproteobacteria bacterium]|nr:bifunctional glutamate N-acetyltransferase/amino-acid acetyltransferase ArgJ [Deltaproteobacteria bacterium]MBW1825989.1 bifunctional glutamate N-acetyltransferase/amino-acid acetyltransferase ArgJ [Deltaproteobacteria bacterium]MBW1969224.1 bifunctional glutamate N-acetyltransferase/amino-acid acetyltransferase ArgJ [Deltaproteobacteria bacterium]MBW2156617.1 bifunctional glutamate N-acetyltransferase/amino-acid acetyltransferase ArgJ [Deltaproteobacteria bacterium]MBW2197169.1 bifunctional